MKKQRGGPKYVTTTKTAGKLYPTIPCNNPKSDTG